MEIDTILSLRQLKKTLVKKVNKFVSNVSKLAEDEDPSDSC